MNTEKMRHAVIVGVVVVCLCGVCALGAVRLSIQSGLEKWCGIAQTACPHPGDPVAAMLEYVQSDAQSLKDRNHVVWALGQARDRRALSVLEALYTGGECDHARSLCQGELDKAIKLCRSDTPNLLRIKLP